jgi:UDP-N-acetylglucosamine 1-carboxyvinyltransferase
MKIVEVNGNRNLNGTVKISGAKNSAVALIPAAILCDESVKISNVPNISDIDALEEILEYLNAKVKRTEDGDIYIESSEIENKEIPESIAKKLRASYYFMGALLGKYKRAELYFPGGCTIGSRPIDLHLKGFEALGAKVEQEDNKFVITADELIGTNIYLDFASVGATINIMLAAVKAKGTTIIENAAKEPEIVNVATFLNNMGAKIRGAGTNTIKIKGVNKLKSCYHEVIPDRIEAATYLIIGVSSCESLTIENIIPEHLEALTQKLIEMGADIEIKEDKIIASNKNSLKSTKIKTLVYPGFPTDIQQLMATLMTQAKGESVIEENIYENRFLNLYELKKMGANIRVEGNKAYIKGITKLKGTNVSASDLRAGASLIIAGLIAEGKTTITNADYILRGYENIVEKLESLGAKIKLTQI